MAGAQGSNYVDDQASLGTLIPQLRDPIGVLNRGWRWIVVTSIVTAVSGVVAARFIPDHYEASADLLMSDSRIPDRFVPKTVEGAVAEQLEEIRGTVLTRRVLADVIRETGLYADRLEKGSMSDLADQLRSDLTFTYTRNSNANSIAVNVSLKGSDPEPVAKTVNAIADKMIDTAAASRSDKAKLTTRFMQREFERADEALRNHQRKLAEFRAQHRGSLPEQQDSTISKLERLEIQRRSLVLQINELEQRVARAARTGGSSGSPEDSELAALHARLAKALAVYTDDHPTVISLRNQIKNYKSPSDGSLGTEGSLVSLEENRRQEMLAEIGTARARIREIDSEVAHLDKMVESTTDITEEYSSLEREEQILNENYNEYLRKLKEAELSQSLENAQQGGRLSLVEAAVPPRSPMIPRWVYTAVALVLAAVLGMTSAVVRELLFFPVVIDEAHLESVTRTPVISSIPRAA